MRKKIALLLSLIMFLSVLSPYPTEFKAEKKENVMVSEYNESANNEITEERTENAKVYQQDDGSKKMEIFQEPVHYKDETTEKWKEINKDLIKKDDGTYKNEENLLSSSFTEKISDSKSIVSMSSENKSIEIENVTKSDDSINPTAAKVTENEIVYPDIFENTDLVYTVGNGKIKEDILINKKPETMDDVTFTFKMNIEGLTAQKNEDGQIFLLDNKTGEKQFEFQKPFMIDSFIPEGYKTNMEKAMPEGSWSEKVEFEMKQDGASLTLIVKPNLEWLQSPERVYPVTIDPTIKVYQPNAALNDTNIRSATPTTTGGADLELGAGYYSGNPNIIRSLLQFDLGALPAGSTIVNAQLNLRLSAVWNDTPVQISLYEMKRDWLENQATWNIAKTSTVWTTKGGDFKTPRLSTQSIGAIDTAVIEPKLYKWPIAAETVQNWINAPSSNFGLMLKSESEGTATYKKFYSGDNSNSAYSPKLTITYYPTSRLGLEDYWSYSDYEVANGTGYINLGTGNGIVQFTDFEVSGRGNSGFSFTRTFNTKATDDSAIGFRWSHTGSETTLELPNKDVIYTDEDGTAHTFTYNATSNTYVGPPGLYLTLSKPAANAYQLKDNAGNRTVFRELSNDPEVNGRIFYIEYSEDRNLNRVNYKRDAKGLLTNIVDATGRTLSLAYTDDRISSISFEGTKKAAYTYYSDGRIETTTQYKDNTNGSTTTFSYNTAGQLSSITDPNNQVTSYTYTNGFLTNVKQPSITDEGISDITYSYDISNFTASEFDALGRETVYSLNSNYIIDAITELPGNYLTTFEYDDNYNILVKTNPKGYSTINKYDNKGNVTSITDEEGNITSYTYNDFSQPKTVTDSNGTISFEYNDYGDVIGEVNTLKERTTYSYYEPYGNLKSKTLPDGTMESYEYDANQNYPTKLVDDLKRRTSIENDKYGNVTNVTDPKGNTLSYDYDEQNLLKATTDEKGNTTSYGYDKNGNITTITNGLGFTTQLAYNNQNQVKSRIEPLGQKAIFEYDKVGNLTKEIQPTGTVVQTEYNELNSPKNIKINGYLKWTYGYDKNGNTTSITNGETNSTTTISYDKTDKVESITNGKQVIKYAYSPTETLVGLTGSSATGGSFSQSYFHDTDDQLKNIKRGGAIQLAYDYKPTGEPAQLRYVNGVHSTYGYDSAQQLTSLLVTKGTEGLLNETIAYDLNGNIKTINTTERVYEYDKTNQLVNQKLTKENFEESYSYDKLGNRLTKTTITNGKTINNDYKYDNNNRLTLVNGKAYSYDDNGNRIKDSQYTYVYNKFDQLITVKNADGNVIASYTYDDEGRRTSKNVNGVITNYHYSSDVNVLFETDSNGNITAEYTYDPDGLTLVLTKNSQNYYYVYNSNKEIVGLTDSTGKYVANYSYDAWGNILSQSGVMAADNPIRYKGYRYDEETKLYYLIARYYQPTEGVFLSTDPVGGDVEDPKTQNGFNYANNNPIMFTDPDGNYVWLAINAGFAAYSGYKAYKSGKSAKSIAASAAIGFIGGSKVKAAKKASHSVYHLLDKSGAVKYVGRTTNINRRAKQHGMNPQKKNLTLKEVKSGLTYSQARGYEHRQYLKNGGKKKLLNVIRPIAKKNKNYKKYMRDSRGL